MKRRFVFLAFCILVAGLDLPDPFAGRLGARDVPPMVDPIFTSLPWSPAQDTDAFQTYPPAPGRPTSTLTANGGGRLRFINVQTGAITAEMQPMGPDFRDPITTLLMVWNGESSTPDTLFVGPYRPSDAPFRAFRLSPSSPPSLLGETPDDWVRQGGFRAAAGDMDADRTPEIIFSSGPGGPGSVSVVILGRDQQVGAGPFGAEFRGGISLATGDLTGDGKAELVAATESNGGELVVLDMVGDQLRMRGTGRPYGPDFRGGIRVAIGDLNGDGFGEIITTPASGPPRVLGFNIRGATPTKVIDFTAFDPSFTGGVFVTTGLIEGEPFIATASGRNLRVFRPATGEWISTDRVPYNPFPEITTDLVLGLGGYTPPPQR
jgi:hypothetical protein